MIKSKRDISISNINKEKLSYDICRKCIKERKFLNFLTDEEYGEVFITFWENSIIPCKIKSKIYHQSIYESPNKDCKYFLEQLMFSEK